MKRLFLSKSSLSKLIAALTAGFLIFSAVLPLSNLKVQALFVSLDVLCQSPNLLDSVSLSQLNDMVMKNILDELNNIGGLPLEGQKTKNNVDTNTDCYLMPNIKRLVTVSSHIGTNTLDLKPLNILNEFLHVYNVDKHIICAFSALLPDIVSVQLVSLTNMLAMPRSDTGTAASLSSAVLAI